MGLKAGTLSTIQLSSILCTLKTYSVFKVPHSFVMWSGGIATQEILLVHLIILRLGTRVTAGSKTDLQPAASIKLKALLSMSRTSVACAWSHSKYGKEFLTSVEPRQPFCVMNGARFHIMRRSGARNEQGTITCLSVPVLPLKSRPAWRLLILEIICLGASHRARTI